MSIIPDLIAPFHKNSIQISTGQANQFSIVVRIALLGSDESDESF